MKLNVRPIVAATRPLPRPRAFFPRLAPPSSPSPLPSSRPHPAPESRGLKKSASDPGEAASQPALPSECLCVFLTFRVRMLS